MPIQSKTYTRDLVLDECRKSFAMDNPPEACPFIAWLEDHPDATPDDWETMLGKNLRWGPEIIEIIIRTAHRHSPIDAANEIQRLYVGLMKNFRWARSRLSIERLFKRPPETHGWDDEALRALIDHLKVNHDDAGPFLDLPEVIRFIPSDIDLSTFPAKNHEGWTPVHKHAR
jgi:hypothetical protein